MAELTRYVRDELYRNDEVYSADEVDAVLKKRDEEHCFAVLDSAKLHGVKIEQLQRDLDALRECVDLQHEQINKLREMKGGK
jgi:hypothetical protein